ncbi:MAG: MFS transporter [Firmicutes bacterium]|nr:MFS transporter [Bacillota bacterium]
MSGKYKPTMIACYLGLITQALNNNLAPLFFIVFHDKFGLSFEMLGRLVLLNFGVQIITSLGMLRFVDRLGFRKAAMLAHAVCFFGMLGLGVLPLLISNTFLALSIAVVMAGFGGGIIEVVISPIVESLPTTEKAAAMSLLHSFYCWGHMGVVIITTLFIWTFGTDIWYFLPMAWALIPLYNLFKFSRVPLLPLVPEGKGLSIVELLRLPVYRLALVLIFAAGAAELTMAQWSSLFAEVALGVPKVVGDLVGPALFALFMAIGRTIFGVWGERINLQKAIQAGSLLSIFCYALAVFSSVRIFALLGASLCGLAVSLMWPGTYSLTSARIPRGGTAMFGFLAVFGNLGGAIGPWVTGFVSDLSQRSTWIQNISTTSGLGLEQVGLRAGLLTGIVFPTLMFIGVRAAMRQAKLNTAVTAAETP